MKSYNGVRKYVRGNLDIFFDEDHVGCAYCPLCVPNTLKRETCARTGEILVNTRVISPDCPMQFTVPEEPQTITNNIPDDEDVPF